MMNKNDADKVLKDTIEYANQEFRRKKKKLLMRMCLLFSVIAVLITTGFFVSAYEIPLKYDNNLVEITLPEDKGLDIKINVSNYKCAKSVLVKTDDNTYDLYINVTETILTRLIDDSDKSDNMMRAGNGIVVDFQSGKLMQYIPNGNSADSIMHIYYIDNLTDKTMTLDDNELISYENKILIWSRESL